MNCTGSILDQSRIDVPWAPVILRVIGNIPERAFLVAVRTDFHGYRVPFKYLLALVTLEKGHMMFTHGKLNEKPLSILRK